MTSDSGGLARLLSDIDADADRFGTWGVLLRDTLAQGGQVFVTGAADSDADARALAADLARRLGPPLATRVRILDAGDVAPLHEATTADALVVVAADGRDEQMLEAVGVARGRGAIAWALTGRWPNPLAAWSDDSFCVGTTDPGSVRAMHSLAIALLVAAAERG